MRATPSLSLFAIAMLLVAPSAAAQEPPSTGEVITCVKDARACLDLDETLDRLIWVIRCIGDSLNGHHCTAP